MQDYETYTELRMVFGEDGARDRLLSFRKELLGHLDLTGTTTLDLAVLRDMAHGIAGRAGFLGFPALADASGKLEEASRLNTDVADALEHWTEQARIAVEYLPTDSDASASDAKDMPPHR